MRVSSDGFALRGTKPTPRGGRGSALGSRTPDGGVGANRPAYRVHRTVNPALATFCLPSGSRLPLLSVGAGVLCSLLSLPSKRDQACQGSDASTRPRALEPPRQHTSQGWLVFPPL